MNEAKMSTSIRVLTLVAAVIVLAASATNIWLATGISGYEHFLRDTNFMPYADFSAAFLIHYRLLFLSVAVALPVAMVVLMLHARTARVFVGLCSLFAVAATQSVFTVHTMLSCWPDLVAAR